MKKLIVALMVTVVSYSGMSQNFDRFEDVSGVTSMVMSQKMFKLLGKVDLNSSDPEMQEYISLVNNLENVKMFSTEDKAVSQDMATEMSTYIASSKLEELMRVKEDDKNVKFYYKPGKSDDFVSEFVMFLNGPLEGKHRTVFFQVTGSIDLKQISKLAKDINFKGSELLNEVDKTKKSK